MLTATTLQPIATLRPTPRVSAQTQHAPVPLWQKILGEQRPGETNVRARQLRATGLRKLFTAVENMLRAEFGNNRGVWNAACGLNGHGAPPLPLGERADVSASERGVRGKLFTPHSALAIPHSFLWDPTRAVCHTLGIAHAKLSSLMKELTGMAAHEIADRLRARSVKKQLRDDLRKFILGNFGTPGGRQVPKDKREVHWMIWKQLRASRRANYGVIEACEEKKMLGVARKKVHLVNDLPSELHDNATWAIRHGFPNFARFRRACLLYYGKTPIQLEWELLEEIAKFYAAAESLRQRNLDLHFGCTDEPGPKNRDAVKQIELFGEEIGQCPTKPYADLWSAWRAAKPDWLKQMQSEFGLSLQAKDEE